MTRKRFKRVTICLEEGEYVILKKMAYQQEKNLSQLIRDQFPILAKIRRKLLFKEQDEAIAKPF